MPATTYLLLLVEKILRSITVRDKRGRDFGDQILHLRVLNSWQQSLVNGINNRIMIVDFVLKEGSIECATVRFPERAHRRQVSLP